MEERFKGHPILIDERNPFQPLSMGVTDFVLKAGCQSIEIDRATVSLQTAHRLEWLRFRLGSGVNIGVDMEICDIASCVGPVDKVEEVQIRTTWVRVQAPFKIPSALELQGICGSVGLRQDVRWMERRFQHDRDDKL